MSPQSGDGNSSQASGPPNENAPAFAPRDFKSGRKPIWCPGCGDYGVLTALYRALSILGRPPEEIAFVSGIGCSGRISGYVKSFGFNALHGRALPIAQGIKLARPDLLVLAAGGDGDGFSIGGGHIAHAARRNIDITYLVLDNLIYGLTKGQLSPTSKQGLSTASSPGGSLEKPINPVLTTLAAGASFVAQGTPADLDGLARLIVEAVRFHGFAFLNIHTPCVTFGQPEESIRLQKEHMHSLDEFKHDPTDYFRALRLAADRGSKLYTGVFYRNPRGEEELSRQIREQNEAARGGAPAPDRGKILERFQIGPKNG